MSQGNESSNDPVSEAAFVQEEGPQPNESTYQVGDSVSISSDGEMVSSTTVRAGLKHDCGAVQYGYVDTLPG
jgi:hypothetical protein